MKENKSQEVKNHKRTLVEILLIRMEKYKLCLCMVRRHSASLIN
jgi:hypothetical protein